MTLAEWQGLITLILGVAAVAGILFTVLRFYIRAFARQELEDIRHELKPNSGSSLKDQVTRLETDITDLKQQNKKSEKSQEKLEQKIDNLTTLFVEYVTTNKK